MIGKAYVSTFQFYDRRANRMSFKNRPVLIIGQADVSDYVILPISRVTNQDNLDTYYDIPLNPANVPLMNLTQLSYVRTHKQSVVHAGELTREIVDFKSEYEDLYLDIISKVEEFQKELINNAI